MKKYLLLLLFGFYSGSLMAQDLVNLGTLIQGGVEDGNKLVDAYIKPLNKAIVFGLTNVDYTQIRKDRAHRLTLSLKLANINIPTEDLTFDVTKLDLQNFEPKDPAKVMTPTVFGDSLQYITLVSKEKDLLGRPLIEFDTPGGSQSSSMPLPFLGAAYRFEYTNLTGQFIPYITVPGSDFKVGMLGLGIQQDLALFIKSLRDKNYGISVQGGGSYLYGHSNLDIQPGEVYSPVTIDGNTTGPYDNQVIDIYYTSFNLAVYFNYDLTRHFSFFAGAGYNAGSVSILVKGTYPVYVADPTGSGSVVAEDIDDPLDISNTYDRQKYELGIRGDWSKFYVQVNYNIADYGGLGLNLGYKML